MLPSPPVRACAVVQPIYWEWDHALYVYPLPDALVLADAAPAASFQFDSCSCINPVRAGQGHCKEQGRPSRPGPAACCLPLVGRMRGGLPSAPG